MAENRELTLAISINQRNPHHDPKDRGTGLLLGTDFRHAVEFSRNGRAETPTSRPSSLAAFPLYTATGAPSRELSGWPLGPARRNKKNTTPSRSDGANLGGGDASHPVHAGP